MLKLNLENVFAVGKNHSLSQESVREEASKLPGFIKTIKASGQGFFSVIDEVEELVKMKEFVAQAKFEKVVILGIGGSALGNICLQQTLKPEAAERFLVLDNIDPIWLQRAHESLDYSKTLFLVITKSGTTPETLAQYFFFRKETENKGLKVQDHFVFITDPVKGLLRKIAQEEGITAFSIPENVGGRFSVLTAVGLLPALLMGIDTEALLRGAKSMRDKFFTEDFDQNLPFQLATVQYFLYQQGKIINVLMPYAQDLFRLADWYRQLLAESIGKTQSRDGEKVYVGLTPVNALGVTDQHSQSQLYNEGPFDKLIMFLEVEKFGAELMIPEDYLKTDDLKYLKGVSFNKLLATELEGTRMAYTQNTRPNLTISIEKIDAYHLGELFMFFEAAVAFLGEYLNINAYDQPGVELSKILTRELLQGK